MELLEQLNRWLTILSGIYANDKASQLVRDTCRVPDRLDDVQGTSAPGAALASIGSRDCRYPSKPTRSWVSRPLEGTLIAIK